jgi:hypothetical protein
VARAAAPVQVVELAKRRAEAAQLQPAEAELQPQPQAPKVQTLQPRPQPGEAASLPKQSLLLLEPLLALAAAPLEPKRLRRLEKRF